MFLIVGLGNLGELYKNTRHNAGFMAVDFISNRHKFIWNHKSKFKADIASGVIENYKVILSKPHTFMNLSGEAVLSVMSYYKIDLSRVIVIHDDIDLELGKIKCKIGGGNGGHNGLKSIDEKLESNYCRVRIGIGRPNQQNGQVSNYVLSNFSDAERYVINSVKESIEQNIHLLLSSELEKFKAQISKNK